MECIQGKMIPEFVNDCLDKKFRFKFRGYAAHILSGNDDRR